MSDVIRWALIGAGRHPELRIAPAISAAENAALQGVWSRDHAKATEFAERHGAPRAYRSIDAVLTDPEVDAVFISTPNNLHAEHTIAAARAGKHVIVEKPMATSPSQSIAMVRAAREHGVQLGVGYHMRHHVVHQAARRLVADGRVGDPIYATASFVLFSFNPLPMPSTPWKSDPDAMGGGGALMGMGVHVIDLLRFLLGREVVAVTALSDGQNDTRPLDRLAQVNLEFEGGVQAHFVCTGRYPYARNDAVVYGSRGRVAAIDAVDMYAGNGHLEVTTRGDGDATIREVVEQPVPDHFVREIEAFGRAIRAGEPFQASGVDGLRAVEITTAIIESLWHGNRVAVERHDVG